MRTIDVAIGSGCTLQLVQRTFQGSARGATDATGTTLWPTALPLLLHLQGVYPSVQDGLGLTRPLRVLELGAGCGLVGLGLAATCGADVLLTDSGAALGEGEVDGTAFTWLRQNVQRNRMVCERDGGRVDSAQLTWGVQADIAAVRSRYPNGFDLVVASDVLYDSARYPELLETLSMFAGSSTEARARSATSDPYLSDDVVQDAVGVIGYQTRIGAERRFGMDSKEFVFIRAPLPQTHAVPPKEGRNPTDRTVAYMLRRGI